MRAALKGLNWSLEILSYFVVFLLPVSPHVCGTVTRSTALRNVWVDSQEQFGGKSPIRNAPKKYKLANLFFLYVFEMV